MDKVRHFQGEGRQAHYPTPAIERIPCVCAQGQRFLPHGRSMEVWVYRNATWPTARGSTAAAGR